MAENRITYVVLEGSLHKVDTIEHEGGFWLVPHWLDMPAQGVTMPNRIIRLASIPHAPMGPNFVIDGTLPKELFEVQTPKQPVGGYEYYELPDIRIPLGK
jgi:hypothetical protein